MTGVKLVNGAPKNADRIVRPLSRVARQAASGSISVKQRSDVIATHKPAKALEENLSEVAPFITIGTNFKIKSPPLPCDYQYPDWIRLPFISLTDGMSNAVLSTYNFVKNVFKFQPKTLPPVIPVVDTPASLPTTKVVVEAGTYLEAQIPVLSPTGIQIRSIHTTGSRRTFPYKSLDYNPDFEPGASTMAYENAQGKTWYQDSLREMGDWAECIISQDPKTTFVCMGAFTGADAIRIAQSNPSRIVLVDLVPSQSAVQSAINRLKRDFPAIDVSAVLLPIHYTRDDLIAIRGVIEQKGPMAVSAMHTMHLWGSDAANTCNLLSSLAGDNKFFACSWEFGAISDKSYSTLSDVFRAMRRYALVEGGLESFLRKERFNQSDIDLILRYILTQDPLIAERKFSALFPECPDNDEMTSRMSDLVNVNSHQKQMPFEENDGAGCFFSIPSIAGAAVLPEMSSKFRYPFIDCNRDIDPEIGVRKDLLDVMSTKMDAFYKFLFAHVAQNISAPKLAMWVRG